MEEREKSALWIIRCISALLILRKQLKKPFREATKDDIKSLFNWMNQKNYKATTHEKFRMVLKVFYKTVYGNGEYYPDAVKWFRTGVGHEKRLTELNLDTAEFLEEDEVHELIDATSSIQRRAFLSCLYESGARPEEFLRLTNADISIDDRGAVLFLRGKTGERRVRIVAYVKYLTQWLELHPLRHLDRFAIWVSEATNNKNKPLGIRGAEKMIQATIAFSGMKNKHACLYLLRHSRATHLAKHLTEAQMCVFFGWTIGTKVIKRYVHLSGRDVDNALLAINGIKPAKDSYLPKPNVCTRCTESLNPTMKYCPRCTLPISLIEAYSLQHLQTPVPVSNIASQGEIELMRNEIQKLKETIESLKQ